MHTVLCAINAVELDWKVAVCGREQEKAGTCERIVFVECEVNGIIRVQSVTKVLHRLLAHALTPGSHTFLSAEDAEANHVFPSEHTSVKLLCTAHVVGIECAIAEV